jgi:hypothetical protein
VHTAPRHMDSGEVVAAVRSMLSELQRHVDARDALDARIDALAAVARVPWPPRGDTAVSP